MKKPEHYLTVITICTGLLILYFLFTYQFLFISALVILTGSICSPVVAEKIHWVWMKLAFVLGYVNTKILLSVVYFTVLYPISMLSRHESLKLKRYEGTYFLNREHLYKPNDFMTTW
jgi:hypothetical protein